MRVFSTEVEIITRGPMKYFDLTSILHDVVSESGIRLGIVDIHAVGATPALILVKNEVLDYLDEFIKTYVPITGWKHGNAYAHLRSALLGTHKRIPIINGMPLLGGTRLYFLETRPVHNHRRKIIFLVRGKKSLTDKNK